jgi:hypothetical protein
MEKNDVIKILEEAILLRKKDIAERQIDIDNHRLSLSIIDEKYSDNKDVADYRRHLEELLRTSILEQTKVKIFLEATERNLQNVINTFDP